MKKIITIITISLLIGNCVKTPRAALDSPLGLILLQMLGGGGLKVLKTIDAKGFYNPYDKNLYFLGYVYTDADYIQAEKFITVSNSSKTVNIIPRGTINWYNAVGDDRYDPDSIYSFYHNTSFTGNRSSFTGTTTTSSPPTTSVGPWQSVTNDGRPLIVNLFAAGDYRPSYLSSAAGATPTWTSVTLASVLANPSVLGLYKNSGGTSEYIILSCSTASCTGYSTSTDGKTWTAPVTPAASAIVGNLAAITFSYSKYYFISVNGTSTNIYTMSAGAIAQVGASITNFVGTSIATNGTSIVINGSSSGNNYGPPIIYHSQDGATFTQAPAITTNATWPNPNTWIVYYEPINKFIISGGRVMPTGPDDGGDRIMSSMDGITWGFN